MLASTFKHSTSLWHYGLQVDLPLDDALDAVINQFLVKRSRRPDDEGDLITKIHDEPTPESRGQCWRKQSHAGVKSSPCPVQQCWPSLKPCREKIERCEMTLLAHDPKTLTDVIHLAYITVRTFMGSALPLSRSSLSSKLWGWRLGLWVRHAHFLEAWKRQC